MYQQSDRVNQCLLHILSVSVPQARPTELTLNPAAVLTATARLSVNCFLTALMTRGALKIHKQQRHLRCYSDVEPNSQASLLKQLLPDHQMT